MSVSSPSRQPGPPPALSAFLRGVERRGAVLAELQAGDADAGDAALAAAMREFRAEAESVPMAAWPERFWTGLLAQPQLRNRVTVALPIDVTDRLGELGSGPRAALLLRVAAGLSEEEAAAVLGVPQSSYRLALQRALPHHGDGRADPEAWQRLREQIHRRIKTLPPDRLVRLSNVREAVLNSDAESTSGVAATAVASPDRTRPRWLLALLWSLLLLCVLALAATFFWQGPWPWQRAQGLEPGARRVRVEPLPESGDPSRFGAETALVAHRDFALLADPEGEAASQDLEFRSWLAAQQAAGVTEPAPPVDLPDADEIAPTPALAAAPQAGAETEAETTDAPP